MRYLEWFNGWFAHRNKIIFPPPDQARYASDLFFRLGYEERARAEANGQDMSELDMRVQRMLDWHTQQHKSVTT